MNQLLAIWIEVALNALVTRVAPLLALVGISVDAHKFVSVATYALLQLIGILWSMRTHNKALAVPAPSSSPQPLTDKIDK